MKIVLPSIKSCTYKLVAEKRKSYVMDDVPGVRKDSGEENTEHTNRPFLKGVLGFPKIVWKDWFSENLKGGRKSERG